MAKFLGISVLGLWLAASGWAASNPPQIITFNDDGGWCWFQDERMLVKNGKIYIVSTASGVHDAQRQGNVEVVTYEIATGSTQRAVLHSQFYNHPGKGDYDDHNTPALLSLPDGRFLAVYATHGTEARFHYRLSTTPGDAVHWGVESTVDGAANSRITYSNLHLLRDENGGKGRINNFFRGYQDSKPSYAFSDDGGESWKMGGVYIRSMDPRKERPYVRYASDGRSTVHMFYSDGHPNLFDNSVWHIFYRDGQLHRSDGTVIAPLSQGLSEPTDGTEVFHGDANNVAWTSDIHLDARGRPYVVYSVQKNAAAVPHGHRGQDLRYRYAFWNGSRWVDHEVGHAGTCLYPQEDDYTGNIALNPSHLDTVYISTNADPVTGTPLISQTDHRRHYEILRGVTPDGGATWIWKAITSNSTADNIRPVVRATDGKHIAVLWLQGRYTAYTDYDLSVVGLIISGK